LSPFGWSYSNGGTNELRNVRAEKKEPVSHLLVFGDVPQGVEQKKRAEEITREKI